MKESCPPLVGWKTKIMGYREMKLKRRKEQNPQQLREWELKTMLLQTDGRKSWRTNLNQREKEEANEDIEVVQ